MFTTGLVEGLRTGLADADGDGYVSLDEAYDFAYGHVRTCGADQTPQRWLYGGEGASILLARNARGIQISPTALPEYLTASLDSPNPAVRLRGCRNARRMARRPRSRPCARRSLRAEDHSGD